ncbi:hypothetical protein PHJA_001410400 [Phtheirospermum japonicum]|uniref:Uncharacterized protein n=1 Tax=Phtheirospermum japonicum TaxID=374723 RepID=A0A830C3E4_9LAMI|nr:hypothetical protein PHJA_001410400 [Phtheirospermum japonicum]
MPAEIAATNVVHPKITTAMVLLGSWHLIRDMHAMLFRARKMVTGFATGMDAACTIMRTGWSV